MSETELKTEIKLIKQGCLNYTGQIVESIKKLDGKVELLLSQNHTQDLRIQKVESSKTGMLALVTAVSTGILSVITGVTTGIVLLIRYS